jgi:hypothetical protein
VIQRFKNTIYFEDKIFFEAKNSATGEKIVRKWPFLAENAVYKLASSDGQSGERTYIWVNGPNGRARIGRACKRTNTKIHCFY